MPWKSGSIIDSRLEFVRLVEQGDLSVSELCRRFGISRQTGHVYLRRDRDEGTEGLKDRSSRPHSSPRRSGVAIETRIVELRDAHPRWGGRKLARRRHGLPKEMLSDNGSPWGGSGSSGYTALEVWLLRLGIRLYHGRAYHPQTQGKEERFHRTLDIEALQARRLADLEACQKAFDMWRPIYNEERPHEGLALAVPASRYRPSPVPFPEQPPAPDYHTDDLIRRVHQDGAVSFKGRRVKLPQAFAHLDVAFRPTGADDVWRAYFARFPIAEADLRDRETNLATVRKVSERV